jgi:hypothetical protein
MNRWNNVYGRSYNSRTGELSAGHHAQFGNVFNAPSRAGGQSFGRTGQYGAYGNERFGNNYGTQRHGGFNGNEAFSTHDGDVFMRDNNANGGWRSVTPSRTYPDSTYSTLGREDNAREIGNQRFNAFRNTYPSGGFHGGEEEHGAARSPGGFGGGHASGGGGRR